MLSLTKKQGLMLALGLVLASIFIFTFRLGANTFLDYDEATYAQVAKEAIESGDYFSFILWSQRWIDKPPMYFWLAIGCAKIFGFSEAALRLPGAVFGILSVIFAWLLAFRLSKNYWIAFLAGAILLFSGEFAFAARQFRLDVPVATAILASVYFFVLGWKNPKWFLAMGASLAVGVLTKSVVGLFSAPAMLGFSLAYKKWSYLKSGWFWGGIILFIALAAPWHIYEFNRYGADFFNIYVGHHLFSRLVSPVVGGQITAWHYIKYFFILVEPWSILFTGLGIWQIVKNGKKRENYNPLSLAALLSFIFIYVIFSASKTKLFYYLEPVYPFMAIFIASSIYDFTAWLKIEKKKIFSGIGILLLIGFFNTYWQVFNLRDGFSEEYAIAKKEQAAAGMLNAEAEKNKAGVLELPVFILEWDWLETLSFYSRSKVNVIKGNELAGEAFYLLAPVELFNFYRPAKDFSARSALIAENKDFQLYRIKAGEQVKIFKQ